MLSNKLNILDYSSISRYRRDATPWDELGEIASTLREIGAAGLNDANKEVCKLAFLELADIIYEDESKHKEIVPGRDAAHSLPGRLFSLATSFRNLMLLANSVWTGFGMTCCQLV